MFIDKVLTACPLKTFFFHGLNAGNALHEIENSADFERPEISHFVDFIRHTERGIMPGDPELIALGTHAHNGDGLHPAEP